jgi:hypothetical protein
VLGSGDGGATNEDCEQDQPGADKSDHGRTLAEASHADRNEVRENDHLKLEFGRDG